MTNIFKYKKWTMGEAMVTFYSFLFVWANTAFYLAPEDASIMYTLNTTFVPIMVFVYTLMKMGTAREVTEERKT